MGPRYNMGRTWDRGNTHGTKSLLASVFEAREATTFLPSAVAHLSRFRWWHESLKEIFKRKQKTKKKCKTKKAKKNLKRKKHTIFPKKIII